LSSQPTVTGAGNKGYLYTGDADNSFYEYTPETNVWTRKADFPGLHRGEAISFSIGNKVYVGGGYYYNDFYAYDPALNTWSKVPDFNFPINIAKPGVMVTVMNNRAYVFAGVNNFRYDPGANAWTRLADLPQPAGGARMSFALNNKIYLTDTDGYLWAWDSFSNAFVQQEAFSIRTGIFYSFVLNGKVYAGGGGSFVNADPPFVSDARLYEWDYTAYP
jgi:N-acetylneuraminic acid mutarotase